VLDADDDNLVDEIGEADEEDEDDGETGDQNDNSKRFALNKSSHRSTEVDYTENNNELKVET
jgi:hypothetical protein